HEGAEKILGEAGRRLQLFESKGRLGLATKARLRAKLAKSLALEGMPGFEELASRLYQEIPILLASSNSEDSGHTDAIAEFLQALIFRGMNIEASDWLSRVPTSERAQVLGKTSLGLAEGGRIYEAEDYLNRIPTDSRDPFAHGLTLKLLDQYLDSL